MDRDHREDDTHGQAKARDQKKHGSSPGDLGKGVEHAVSPPIRRRPGRPRKLAVFGNLGK